MKKLLYGLVSFLVILPVLSYSEEGYYSYSYARLSYVKGDIYVQRSGDLGYEQGTINLPLSRGDRLGTKDGLAEVHFGRQNYLRLDAATQVELKDLPQRDLDPTKLHILGGNIYLRINSLDREKNFEVHTPDASFYVMSEGLFRFDVKENKETEVFVLDGSLEAAGQEGSLWVRENESLVASNGRFVSGPSGFYARNDEFSRWSEYRDSLLGQRVSSSYLPSELYEYEPELAVHGRWVYEQPYGHVWVPYVYYDDWRPYYYGHWIWLPIIGWTWVSDEPWGWCTYHYGRWGWRFGLGWYWMPTRHWGPAWVSWWWGYDYWGWCPLGYYDRPIVIINNYFYDNYRGDYYAHNNRALTVVHKDQLQARRVHQAALDRNSLKSLGKINLQNAQPRIRPTVNRTVEKEALNTFSKTSVRPVNRSYESGKKSLSPSLLRSPERSTSDSERAIRRSNVSPGSQDAERGKVSSDLRRLEERGANPSSASRISESASKVIKVYPSQRPSSNSSSPSRSISESRPSRELPSRSEPRTSEPRKMESGERQIIYQKSSSSPSTSSQSSRIREYGSSNSSPTREIRRNPESSSSRVSQSSSYSSPSRSYSRSESYTSPQYSSPSRGSSSPSSIYSSPSRSSSSPSRSYSSPSRSYSSPSRSSSSPSYSSPSRSYSSPSYSSPSRSYSSPSYSSPSRSYSSPSYSSPSRSYSYSSPSRSSSSYSSPSRSYSSPSRSSSSSSRSSSGSSRSSSGGSVRRK